MNPQALKITAFMIGLILVFWYSCQKPQVASAVTNVGSSNNVTNTVNTLKADTVAVPGNAVNAKTYGAVGDGVHDDTQALQNVINNQKVIVLTSGTYIINTTLNLASGVKIYGTGGAVIKSGTSMSGTLLNNGMYFYINNVDNCGIYNINFQPSTQPFSLANWANAVIYVINSIGTTVQSNMFNFKQPYGITGLEAVWISGSRSNNNLIKKNSITSLGIEYAENGAGGTTADSNIVKNSFADGLSAHGNATVYCTNNIVSNNTITNAGFMGIEDWGNVDGTIIENNIITGTGKDSLQKSEGMGISAVGVNSLVINNQITDCQLYYIEVGGNKYVYSNTINDVAGQAFGIFVNFTGAPSANDKLTVSSILNNTINNCATAIQVFGNVNPSVSIQDNVITNPAKLGISIDSAAPLFTIDVSNNKILINSPNTQQRMCYHAYTSQPHGAANQTLTYNGNSLTYSTTSSGGTGNELGFVLGIDNTVLNGNTVTGNGISAGGAQVYAISANNGSALNVTLTNNNIYSALINYQGITIKSSTGNNF